MARADTCARLVARTGFGAALLRLVLTLILALGLALALAGRLAERALAGFFFVFVVLFGAECLTGLAVLTDLADLAVERLAAVGLGVGCGEGSCGTSEAAGSRWTMVSATTWAGSG